MRYRGWPAVLLLGFLALMAVGFKFSSAHQSDGGKRYRLVEVTINQYVWHVISKTSGKTLCEIIIEHDRQPTPDETLAVCSQAYTPSAGSTPTANITPQPTLMILDRDTFLSSILYRLVETRQLTRTITVVMQEMTLNIEVLKTANGGGEAFVLLSAYEPEPDYHITTIEGTINAERFICAGSQCRLPVVGDSQVEFWATSSFGDQSEHLTAILRVSRQNDYPTIEITSLYPYEPFADSCAQIWNARGYTAPEWTQFPPSPAGLNTGKNLYYLAGQLIRAGLVDASDCPGGGLLADGSPNGCGMDRAKSEMIAWQNQYNVILWSSGRTYGIPPILIKSILEIESQFWPANLRRFLDEYGLAQINQWGADVALRWDHDLYQEICSNIFTDCSLPYASLPAPLQAIMRGGLVRAINAECPECAGGIDYARAVKSIPAITRVIRSNCQQAKFIMDERTVNPAYEDMWKFTLVSYHSGYYCLDEGIRRTKNRQLPVTWNNFAANLDPACIGAVDYINGLWKTMNEFKASLITIEPPIESIPLASIVPAPTPTPSPTPILAKSQLEVIVFVDRNDNRIAEEEERINAQQVVVTFEDGSSLTRKTENGSAVFDLTGKAINSRVIVSLPFLFRSQDVFIPEYGVVPVIFKIEQSDLPPVLP